MKDEQGLTDFHLGREKKGCSKEVVFDLRAKNEVSWSRSP